MTQKDSYFLLIISSYIENWYGVRWYTRAESSRLLRVTGIWVSSKPCATLPSLPHPRQTMFFKHKQNNGFTCSLLETLYLKAFLSQMAFGSFCELRRDCLTVSCLCVGMCLCPVLKNWVGKWDKSTSEFWCSKSVTSLLHDFRRSMIVAESQTPCM